jgi:tetratricopeptide (TPR) repeat protein
MTLAEAFDCVQRNDLKAAEALLAKLPDHPSSLHLLGVIRVRQGQLEEASELLARSVSIRPEEAQAQLNYGKVLNVLGRHQEACEALRTALALDANLVDAAFLLGKSLYADTQVQEAIDAYKIFLAARPNHVPAQLALSQALIETGDLQSAVLLLDEALLATTDPRLSANLHLTIASALRKRSPVQALDHLGQAQAFDPRLTELDPDRALLLEELHRFQDARTIYKQVIERNPVNAKAHRNYNDLLYRLGDDAEFLASYDSAPRTQELMLDKAQFLLDTARPEEAEQCYKNALARYSYSKQAVLGLGLALIRSGKLPEALAAFECATRLYPESVDTYCNLAGALAQSGDPQKACLISRKALEMDPNNQVALALWGTSLRLMNDAFEEVLNGYDDFIQVFDLEPPDGYADMNAFNTELSASLEEMHPPVREYLRQSLRGGTQTKDNLFDMSHLLVGKLRVRFEEAVDRYVGALRLVEQHPFQSRKGTSFRFAGSWSSRLRDRGFHINHLHPGGWISSCYYVALPEVVKDQNNHQGWIKFGEPSFPTDLQPRRVIQPAVGRLVLFPSFMWHGTVPFHSSQTRTTIAFDVLPEN